MIMLDESDKIKGDYFSHFLFSIPHFFLIDFTLQGSDRA